FNSPRLTGGPAWVRTQAFDIEAVPPAGSITPDLAPAERDMRVRAMLQNLLADRFKLRIQTETRELPAYVISVSRNGSKLKASSVTDDQCTAGTAKTPCHRLAGGQGRGLHGKAVTMSDIASFVENWSDRPVVDESGLKGLFEVDTDGW